MKLKLKNTSVGFYKSISIRATVCAGLLSVSVACLSQQLPKTLLLTGNGNDPVAMEGYPPWIHEFHIPTMSKILQDVTVIDVTTDLSTLNRENLRQYESIISYSMFLTPSPSQLDALYEFISEGKSLLTIHCGILSFLNWEKYEEVIGGIFIGGPSSVPEKFNVSTTNTEFWGYNYSFRDYREHPVSKVVNDFVIEDELYHFQPAKSEFHVIARAENLPVMWWHPVGKGKVMSITLGHSLEAKETDGFRELLKNGMAWLLDYPLIESIQLRPISTREKDYPAYIQLSKISHKVPGTTVTYAAQGDENINLSHNKRGEIGLQIIGKTGTHKARLSVTSASGLNTKRDINITVIEDGTGNIASYYGNKASASSTEGKNILFDVSNAIDGDPGTRWSSDFIDPSWIQIDLRKSYSVRKIVLQWESSYATDYAVEISENGTKWKTVADVKNSDGETDIITFKPALARFVKITGTERSRELYGYSLFEVEVYQE